MTIECWKVAQADTVLVLWFSFTKLLLPLLKRKLLFVQTTFVNLKKIGLQLEACGSYKVTPQGVAHLRFGEK